MIAIEEVYSLDWEHILHDAIQSRPTSWGNIEPALVEYRNAGDCLAGAVIAEMREKGLIKKRKTINDYSKIRNKIDYSIMKPIDVRICEILINARRPLSTLEIAKYGNISWLTAKKHLNELLKTVQNIKTYKNGRTHIWVIDRKVK